MDATLERELIRRSQQRDRDAINQLYLSNIGLIKTLTRKFHPVNGHLDEDDLEQHAWLIFLQSIQKFDIERGNRLSTYIYIMIRGNLSNYVRDAISIRKKFAINHPTEKIVDMFPDDNFTIEDIFKVLNFREQFIIRMWLEGKSQREIGHRLFLCRNWVQIIFREALLKIKDLLDGETEFSTSQQQIA
jgi:RNA polymerase sigma factor (sigma-70 family)